MSCQAVFIVKACCWLKSVPLWAVWSPCSHRSSETTLFSESCLLCKINSWSLPGTPGPPGKCSTLSYFQSPAVTFPKILKASNQLISIYILGQKHSSNVHLEPTGHGHFMLCPPTFLSQALSDTWHKPFPELGDAVVQKVSSLSAL